jgi:hypothetical protein
MATPPDRHARGLARDDGYGARWRFSHSLSGRTKIPLSPPLLKGDIEGFGPLVMSLPALSRAEGSNHSGAFREVH